MNIVFQVCATYADGFRSTAVCPVGGPFASLKAKRVGKTIVKRYMYYMYSKLYQYYPYLTILSILSVCFAVWYAVWYAVTLKWLPIISVHLDQSQRLVTVTAKYGTATNLPDVFFPH